MHNMSLPREIQFPIDEIASPLGAQLKFSESELFPETLQNSEVASISSDNLNNNCSYEELSSYNNNNNNSLSNITMDDNMNKNYNNIPLLLDHHDTTTILCFEDDDQLGNNASTDFASSSPSFSLPQHRQHMNNNNYYYNINNNEEMLFTMPLMYNYNNVEISLGDETYNIPERQPVTGYDTEESSFVSSMTVPSHNIDPMISIGNYLPFPFDVNGLFLGNDVSVHNQELEFQGDNNIDGTFYPDSAMVRVFNYPAAHLQHQHQLVDHNDLKVGKLSVEERKRKIHRYLKKRNERNFSKKIKYACRKTLADSRPRVRGRFAKNEEIARTATCSNNHEDNDTDEDGSLFSNPTSHLQHKVVKADEDLDSSDIFAHISGVNSFKCNYSIQSWI